MSVPYISADQGESEMTPTVVPEADNARRTFQR
jgi:hypothetical protein